MRKILILGAVCCLAVSPAMAAGLHVYGSYWDVDDLGDTAGGGASLAIPLGAAQRVNLDFGATYYQQFEDNDFFDRLIDNHDSPFLKNSVEALPLDAGLSINLGQHGPVNPVLGAGATYFLLDTDRGEVDDEVGWYAKAGLELGSEGSVGFFTDAVYRNAEAKVRTDPDDLGDVPGLDFDEETPIDLGGFGLNAGVVWRF